MSTGAPSRLYAVVCALSQTQAETDTAALFASRLASRGSFTVLQCPVPPTSPLYPTVVLAHSRTTRASLFHAISRVATLSPTDPTPIDRFVLVLLGDADFFHANFSPRDLVRDMQLAASFDQMLLVFALSHSSNPLGLEPCFATTPLALAAQTNLLERQRLSLGKVLQCIWVTSDPSMRREAGSVFAHAFASQIGRTNQMFLSEFVESINATNDGIQIAFSQLPWHHSLHPGEFFFSFPDPFFHDTRSTISTILPPRSPPTCRLALLFSRIKFDKTTDGLPTISGVAGGLRKLAVDLILLGFYVTVLCDTDSGSCKDDDDDDNNNNNNNKIDDDNTQGEQWRRNVDDDKVLEDAMRSGQLVWLPHGATHEKIHLVCEEANARVAGLQRAELVVAFVGRGVFDGDKRFGIALGSKKYDVSRETHSGLYNLDMLRDSLGVEDRQTPWRNVLVILDTCHSGAALESSEPLDVCLRIQPGDDAAMMAPLDSEQPSYQCLASCIGPSSSFALGNGTLLHSALRRALWSPTSGVSAPDWVTVGALADRVNVEMRTIIANTRLAYPGDSFDYFRQSCFSSRLPWRASHNTGEFLLFLNQYKARDRLAMVPAVPASFTGREKELRQLEARLKQSGNVTISAAGGLGKSTLAAEYARRNAHEYHSVIWVQGTSATTMMGSYREAVRYIPLNHVDARNAKDDEVVAAVKEWLAHERGWLMVVDGCDVITDEMKTMMPGGVMEGKMVVTTRLQRVDELGALLDAPVELGVFDEEERMEFMRKRLPERGGEDEELKTIVEQLGGIPLALDLATAYLAATPHVSAGEYRARIEADRLKALKKRSGGGGLEDRVVATYEPSLARAMEIGGKEMVQKMVGVMGFLEGGGMEVEVLRLLVMGQRKKEEEADEDAFDVALGALCRVSVVDVHGGVVLMHPLVQDVCRMVAFGDEEEMWSELRRVGRVLQEEVGDGANIHQDVEWRRQVGVHGMRVMDRACAEVERRRRGGETEQYADVVWLSVRLSEMWKTLALFHLARIAAESACECVYDKECVLGAHALVSLGDVCERQSDYLRALAVYGQALAIQEEQSSIGGEEMGKTCHRIAFVFEARRVYGRALEYYERALTIKESCLGPDHPSTCETLNNMVNVLCELSEYSRALQLNERLMSIQQLSATSIHPSCLGDTLNNMARVFEAQGDYSRAIEYYERALDIRKTSLGYDHPFTGDTFNNMASVFQAQGDYSRALEYSERALTIREKTHGSDHPSTGDILNNMAGVFQAQGDYSRALEYYERALAIHEKSLGPDHPSTGSTLNNMAGVFSAQGDYSRALEYYERALTIREKSLGPDHPSTSNTLNNMARVFQAQGDYSRALEYYERALTICEKSVGPDHPSTGDTLDNLAGVFQAQGDYSRALEYYERALAIHEKSVGPDHPSTGGTLNNMAAVFLVQGAHKRALDYYERALAVLEKSIGLSHPDTVHTLKNMIVVFKVAGMYSRAVEFFALGRPNPMKLTGSVVEASTGQILCIIAGVFEAERDDSRALAYFERALAMYEKSPRPNHPDTGDTLSHIARVLQHQRDFSRALEFLERALGVFNKALGRQNLSSGTALKHIGDVYREQTEYARALENYKHALVIQEKSLGADHRDTGNTLSCMGAVLKAQGDYTRASEYYRRAVAISEKGSLPRSESVSNLTGDLCDVWPEDGALAVVEKFERALALQSKSKPVRTLQATSDPTEALPNVYESRKIPAEYVHAVYVSDMLPTDSLREMSLEAKVHNEMSQKPVDTENRSVPLCRVRLALGKQTLSVLKGVEQYATLSEKATIAVAFRIFSSADKSCVANVKDWPSIVHIVSKRPMPNDHVRKLIDAGTVVEIAVEKALNEDSPAARLYKIVMHNAQGLSEGDGVVLTFEAELSGGRWVRFWKPKQKTSLYGVIYEASKLSRILLAESSVAPKNSTLPPPPSTRLEGVSTAVKSGTVVDATAASAPTVAVTSNADATATPKAAAADETATKTTPDEAPRSSSNSSSMELSDAEVEVIALSSIPPSHPRFREVVLRQCGIDVDQFLASTQPMRERLLHNASCHHPDQVAFARRHIALIMTHSNHSVAPKNFTQEGLFIRKLLKDELGKFADVAEQDGV